MPSRRQALSTTGALIGALAGCADFALSSTPENQRWSTTLGEFNGTRNEIAAIAGSVYVLAGEHIFAVDATHGESNWSHSIQRPYAIAADANGIYITEDSLDSPVAVRAFAPGGEQQWKAPLQDGTAITIDANTVYIGNQMITALNRLASQKRKRWHTDVSLGGARALTVENDTLYAICEEGISAWDSTDRSLQWDFGSETDSWGLDNPPLVVDGTVYVGTLHGAYAFDTSDGSVQWHTAFKRGYVSGVRGLHDGAVYATITNSPSSSNVEPFGALYRLSPGDGLKQKKIEFDERIHQIALTSSMIVLGTRAGNLIAIDPLKLTEEWKVSVADEAIQVAVDDDIAYTLDRDNTLTSFNI